MILMAMMQIGVQLFLVLRRTQLVDLILFPFNSLNPSPLFLKACTMSLSTLLVQNPEAFPRDNPHPVAEVNPLLRWLWLELLLQLVVQLLLLVVIETEMTAKSVSAAEMKKSEIVSLSEREIASAAAKKKRLLRLSENVFVAATSREKNPKRNANGISEASPSEKIVNPTSAPSVAAQNVMIVKSTVEILSENLRSLLSAGKSPVTRRRRDVKREGKSAVL
jgi:hypothetical protein